MDGFAPGQRLDAIHEHVLLYIGWLHGEEVIQDGKVVEEMTPPSAYYWLRWTEKWGMPNAGGWLDQPYDFMMDINEASMAEQEYMALAAFNETQRKQNGG